MGYELARVFVRVRLDAAGMRSGLRSVKGETQKTLQGIELAAGGILSAVAAAGSGLIQQATTLAGEFEQTNIAFSTILGSEELAKEKLQELADFAARTPFELTGIENNARQLIAAGYAADELIPTLRSIGDVSAGIGKGEFGLERIIANMAQVRRASKLTGRELRDFGILGVPMVSELADMLGVAESEIANMTSRSEISADMVEQAFNRMTGAGGMFENLMEKQNQSMMGRFSNLKDSWTQALREMGAAIIPTVTKIVNALITVVDGIKVIIKQFPKLTAAIITTTTAVSGLVSSLIAARIAARLLGISVRSALIGSGVGIFFVLAGAALGWLIAKFKEAETSSGLLGKAFAAIKGVFNAVSGAIMKGLMGIVNGIKGVIERNKKEFDKFFFFAKNIFFNLLDVVVNVWGVIKTAAKFAWNFVASIIKSVFGVTMFTVSEFVNFFMKKINSIMNAISLFTTDWGLTWKFLKTSVILIFLEIANSVMATMNRITGLFKATVSTGIYVFSNLGTALMSVFDAVVTTVKAMFIAMWEGIKGDFNGRGMGTAFVEEFAKEMNKLDTSFLDGVSDKFKTDLKIFQGPKNPLAMPIDAAKKNLIDLQRQMEVARMKNVFNRKAKDIGGEPEDEPKPRGRKPRSKPSAPGVTLDAGRFAIPDFGSAIQDAFLTGGDLDGKRNSLLETMVDIQNKQLEETKRRRQGGGLT